MKVKSISLGPWRGINNVEADTHRAFQPPGQGAPLAYVSSAVDVDFDSEGWASTRPALVVERVLEGGQGGWEIDGRVFVQEGGTLYEGLANPLARVSGLVRRMALCSHAGLIFGTDGVTHVEIDPAGTVRYWGLPVPSLTLSAIGGALQAGRYLVQGSWSDARGNEGGVSDLGAIVLASTGGISVAATAPAGATHLNVYASQANQEHTSFVAKVAVGALPSVVSTAVSVADPPVTEGMTGPWSGALGIASWRAFVLLWRDNVVVHSEALEPHLFHPDSIWQFPSAVRAVEALTDGVWVATAAGLWWVSGEDPATAIPALKTAAPCLAGSCVVDGQQLPTLQTRERVALFVTADGLVAGMPGGGAVNLTDGVYRFPAGARASFALVERDGLRQMHIAIAGA